MPRPDLRSLDSLFRAVQSPASFRILGLGGFALFSVLGLSEAWARGRGYAILGILLLGTLWLESSSGVCRRCRFYGTWHCLGQGMAVSKLFSRLPSGVSLNRLRLHFGLIAAYLLYGLFWLWHSPLLGPLFTLWLPLAVLSAIAPAGFSWRGQPGSATRPA